MEFVWHLMPSGQRLGICAQKIAILMSASPRMEVIASFVVAALCMWDGFSPNMDGFLCQGVAVCVCVCVCMCVSVHVCVCVCLCMCVYLCVCMFMCGSVYSVC